MSTGDLVRQTCEPREVVIPRAALSPDHVRLLMSASARRLQDKFPELRKRYWGQHLWARGYFCATVGAVGKRTIKCAICTLAASSKLRGTRARSPIFRLIPAIDAAASSSADEYAGFGRLRFLPPKLRRGNRASAKPASRYRQPRASPNSPGPSIEETPVSYLQRNSLLHAAASAGLGPVVLRSICTAGPWLVLLSGGNSGIGVGSRAYPGGSVRQFLRCRIVNSIGVFSELRLPGTWTRWN